MTDLVRVDDGPVATVYSGHRAGVPMAVKVFPRRFDKRTLSAFTKEQAKLATVRRVRSILPVAGVDETSNGESALWMELCPRSLTSLMEHLGRLSPPDAVVLGHALATALAAAHGAGVVHGGVTPGNVLFRQTGDPALADFGVTLRRAFARDPLHAIEYLPPESLRTGTLDESTDLYGLGAVLHFALSGRSPRPGRLGEQPGERVLRILGEPVPALNVPDVPTGLSTVVARLLSADPSHRPPDATTVVEQLERMLPAPPPRAPREDWDDFSLPPAPSPAPLRPSPPPPPDPHPHPDDFDDFRPPRQAAPVSAPPAPHRAPVDAPGTPAEAPPVLNDFTEIPHVDRSQVKVLASPLAPPGKPARPLIRYDLLAGAALLLALLALVPLLLLRSDPDEMSSAPRLPQAPGGATTADVLVELAEPVDRTDKVELTWTASRELDFAVVIAAEGRTTRYRLAERNHAMTVEVEPGLKYCFLVQATDGDQVYESAPVSLRGATCRK